jgi:GNAT superfamily N-acetyltransferase
MRNPLRLIFPRRETYLLLTARLAGRESPPPPVDPAQIETAVIGAADHPVAGALEQFCTAGGFPRSWSVDMLGDGAQAFIAVDTASRRRVAAMAWLVRRPYYVAEVDHTIDPAGGVYFFGDFVAPVYRGRRLQRLLLEHRLACAAQAGVPHAYTIIRDDNGPSIANYRALGFVPTTALARTHWPWRDRHRLTFLPTLDKSLPALDRDARTRTLRPTVGWH